MNKVRQFYGELDRVTEITKGRMRWLGHVERISEEKEVKRLYQNIPEGSRSVGRPRVTFRRLMSTTVDVPHR